MEQLRELWQAIKSFFRAIWDSFWGIFLYTQRISSLMRHKQEQDEQLFFKNESKKKMFKWVVDERQKIKKIESKMSAKEKKDASIYNYMCTVLLQKNPQDTVEDILFKFYCHLHPYLIVYMKSHRLLQAAVNSKDPEKYLLQRIGTLKSRFRDIPDLGVRATQILEVKKKVATEMKLLDAKYKKHKRDKMERFDAEMIAIDRAIAEQQKRDAEAKLGELNKKTQKEKEDEARRAKQNPRRTGGDKKQNKQGGRKAKRNRC